MFSEYFQKRDKKKILVVDDDPINQCILAIILNRWNFITEFSGNGIKALEYLRQQTCDLILMDIEMPELNGFDATSRIRQELKLTTPIIAVSSNSAPADIQKAFDCGMDEYVGKPVDPENLKSAIRRHLESVYLV